jgi:hypothetical protein
MNSLYRYNKNKLLNASVGDKLYPSQRRVRGRFAKSTYRVMIDESIEALLNMGVSRDEIKTMQLDPENKTSMFYEG